MENMNNQTTNEFGGANYNSYGTTNNTQNNSASNTLCVPRPMSAFSAVIMSFLICTFLGWFIAIPSIIVLAKWVDYQYKAQIESQMQAYYVQKSLGYATAFTITLIASIVVSIVFWMFVFFI